MAVVCTAHCSSGVTVAAYEIANGGAGACWDFGRPEAVSSECWSSGGVWVGMDDYMIMDDKHAFVIPPE